MTLTFPPTTVSGNAPSVAPDLDVTAVRAAPSLAKQHRHLGLLAELPGHWVGHGFNLIARPDFEGGNIFFLELNPTRETLDFTPIGGNIPNRGSEQKNINLHGLHYLQQVSDTRTDTGIHIEPGLWIHVPPTKAPKVAQDTYVRQATVPHGDSLLAQSIAAFRVAGPPDIQPVDSTPFTGAVPGLNETAKNPDTDPTYLRPFRHRQLPPHVAPGRRAAHVIKNPALVLVDAIKDQTITDTATIQISTDPVGGIVNIPFVVRNANAIRMDAIFWIETVNRGPGDDVMQLQYVQRVILEFAGLRWPHISVATLRKQ
jgi:hypothetical protein